MNKTIDRLKAIFLGAFVLFAATAAIAQVFWLAPGQKCESGGNWWDWRTRTCAHPILISDITGRIVDDPKSREAAKAAKAARADAPKPH